MGRSMQRFYNPIARPSTVPSSSATSPAPSPSPPDSASSNNGSVERPRRGRSDRPWPSLRRREGASHVAAGLSDELRNFLQRRGGEATEQQATHLRESDDEVVMRVRVSHDQAEERDAREYRAVREGAAAKEVDERGMEVKKYSEAPFDLDQDHPDAVFEAFLTQDADGELVVPPNPFGSTPPPTNPSMYPSPLPQVEDPNYEAVFSRVRRHLDSRRQRVHAQEGGGEYIGEGSDPDAAGFALSASSGVTGGHYMPLAHTTSPPLNVSSTQTRTYPSLRADHRRTDFHMTPVGWEVQRRGQEYSHRASTTEAPSAPSAPRLPFANPPNTANRSVPAGFEVEYYTDDEEDVEVPSTSDPLPRFPDWGGEDDVERAERVEGTAEGAVLMAGIEGMRQVPVML